jgi:hypothetical protein
MVHNRYPYRVGTVPTQFTKIEKKFSMADQHDILDSNSSSAMKILEDPSWMLPLPAK